MSMQAFTLAWKREKWEKLCPLNNFVSKNCIYDSLCFNLLSNDSLRKKY